MARLPKPGSDAGSWGTILNEFLEVSHTSSGTLKSSALTNAGGVTSVNGKTPTSGSVTLSTSDLADVSIASPSNGQVLTYNSSDTTWKNQTC